jgi:protein TonB
MSPELKKDSEVTSEESLGSLGGCLVDGDADQCTRERRVRRSALAISILLQSAILSALILVPLFGKAERITLTIATPMPPYSRYRNTSNNSGVQRQHLSGPKNPCRFCAPTNIPPSITMREHTSSTAETPFEGLGQNIPGAIDGVIPLSDPGRKGPRREDIETRVERPRVLHLTQIDPAMLIHRVEPVYPPLARQTHRDGRVELRAIIGTDGTIQSLQIVASDPLFDLSARDAVQQWRYKPTILNGQPVEIDTYITVIYTTQH